MRVDKRISFDSILRGSLHGYLGGVHFASSEGTKSWWVRGLAGKMECGGLGLLSRRAIVLCVLLGVLAVGWLRWRDAPSRRAGREAGVPSIDKQPVNFATRTFDPNAPPADMPPLAYGEDAECDSDFWSHATVGGESVKTDATHATVTITRVSMMLRLNVTIWAPTGVTQHVMEHEQGHRQISEHYYQTAGALAERIAAAYEGRQIAISGADLDTEFNKALQQAATDITNEYNRELGPGATQQYYDTITDHGRNEMAVRDAVAAVVANIKISAI